MKRYAVPVVAMFAFALAGCPHPHKSDNQGFLPGPPAPPPPYPQAVNMPIDPALQLAAKNEIDSAVNSNDELIRAHAIETLKDSKLPETEAMVLRSLGDPSRLVRKAAAYSAGELQFKSALGRLTPLLDAEKGASPAEAAYALQERMAAIFALHRMGNTTYSHELEKTATDNRPAIRGETAFIFGRLGDKSAIPLLLEMLHSDADYNVRLQAAEALWLLGDQEGENKLFEATISRYASDQMIAALALAEPRDSRVLGRIEAMYNSDHLEIDLVCARATGMLGSDSGYGIAMKGAQSNDPRQRSLAAMAFGGIGRTDAQPRLAKLLKDSDPDVRLAAAGALVEIAEKNGR
jgi:HEAT repeat protein